MAELAPARALTEPRETGDKKRSERPSRLRATSFRKDHSHRHRHLAKETVQSAIDLKPPIAFEHLLRRDKKDSDSSRRGSSHTQQRQDAQQQQYDGSREVSGLQTRQVREADVDKARKENEKREADLRESLQGVEEVGMSSTRQLDDTYYAILEKAAILRSTVASLQQLVEESRKLHSTFQDDSRKVDNDIRQSAESFGQFEQQGDKISDLVSKLEASRGRTEELNGRLESARLRVEAYEERENVKAVRRRARFNITWMSLLGVAVLIVAILAIKNRKLVEKQFDIVSDHLSDVVGPLSSRLMASPTEDPYLRKLFDEL